jgi:hypothetical protein
MTNDPLRQADIERRLANLAKAPRCGARTRMGSPCRLAGEKELGVRASTRLPRGVSFAPVYN